MYIRHNHEVLTSRADTDETCRFTLQTLKRFDNVGFQQVSKDKSLTSASFVSIVRFSGNCIHLGKSHRGVSKEEQFYQVVTSSGQILIMFFLSAMRTYM